MFRKLALLTMAVIVFAAAAFAPASAKSSNASVFVVHGIPGLDLGLPEEQNPLPVDISVDGACALQSFKFGDIAGPLSLPEGEYLIEIRLANPAAPCSNDPVISAPVPFAAGENATVIAHLTADGAPTASKFTNQLKPAHPGMSRVILHHTAKAPAVDIDIERSWKYYPMGKSLENVPNGAQGAVDLFPGRWSASIFPAGGSEAVFGPANLRLRPFTAYLVYAVGSLDKGTFTLLTQSVQLPRGWR